MLVCVITLLGSNVETIIYNINLRLINQKSIVLKIYNSFLYTPM